MGGKSKKKQYKKNNNNSWMKTKGSGITKSFPIGKTFKFKCRYVEDRVELNPGAGGTSAETIYRLNSLYDPNLSGVGHQPLGFDQIMPLYDHFTVIGARARVNFTNTSSGGSVNAALILTDDATALSTLAPSIENGNCRWTTLGDVSTASATKTMSINCNTSQFLGHKVMQDSKYSGSISQDPLDGVYLHVFVEPTTTSDLGPTIYTIEIEYIAILTEPKVLGQS